MPRRSRGRSVVLDRATLSYLAAALRASELPMAQRNSMRTRIQSRIQDTLPVPPSLVAQCSVGWEAFWPNVWVKVLRQDIVNNIQTALFRLLPGAVVPPAQQQRGLDEQCLVLEGEVLIGGRRIAQGDTHSARNGQQQRITSLTGAMLMVRSIIPPSTTSQAG